MLGFGFKVIWKALATLFINNPVGQIKLLSEHLSKSLYLPVCLLLSPRLHRPKLACWLAREPIREAQGKLP